jgi:hypothetical protein
MARTKKTEKAVPKMGEIISFASLRARRDAKRADAFGTFGISWDEETAVGDVVLIAMKDGSYTLDMIKHSAPMVRGLFAAGALS